MKYHQGIGSTILPHGPSQRSSQKSRYTICIQTNAGCVPAFPSEADMALCLLLPKQMGS